MSIIIVEDVGNKENKHILKHQWFNCHEIDTLRAPLPVGDYILYTEAVADVIRRKTKRRVALKKMDFLGSYGVAVDTKRDMQEIIGNICGKQHDRFRDECILAQNNGIKLYVLVENEDGVTSIDDVSLWKNPRAKIQRWVTTSTGQKRKVLKYPDATRGETLAKAMRTMQEKYGVVFKFTTPERAGEEILRLLTLQEG